jgi:hypothetical protein
MTGFRMLALGTALMLAPMLPASAHGDHGGGGFHGRFHPGFHHDFRGFHAGFHHHRFHRFGGYGCPYTYPYGYGTLYDPDCGCYVTVPCYNAP